MTGYYVESERHVGKPMTRHGVVSDPILFRYAVKRADGSLLYRTTSRSDAEEILASLNTQPQREAA